MIAARFKGSRSLTALSIAGGSEKAFAVDISDPMGQSILIIIL